MSKHTPGPWHIIDLRQLAAPMEQLTVSVDGLAICRICNVISGRKLDAEDEANAHLIAAAPDLLSELENLRNETKEYLVDLARCQIDATTLVGAIRRAERAMQKARGGANGQPNQNRQQSSSPNSEPSEDPLRPW